MKKDFGQVSQYFRSEELQVPGTYLETEYEELTEVQQSAYMLVLEMKAKGLVWVGFLPHHYFKLKNQPIKHLFRCADKPTERQQGYNTGITNKAKDSFRSHAW